MFSLRLAAVNSIAIVLIKVEYSFFLAPYLLSRLVVINR